MVRNDQGVKFSLLERYTIAPVQPGHSLDEFLESTGCRVTREPTRPLPKVPPQGLATLELQLFEVNCEDGRSLEQLLQGLRELRLAPASALEMLVAMAQYTNIDGGPVICLDAPGFEPPNYPLFAVERNRGELLISDINFDEPTIWGNYLCFARNPS